MDTQESGKEVPKECEETNIVENPDFNENKTPTSITIPDFKQQLIVNGQILDEIGNVSSMEAPIEGITEVHDHTTELEAMEVDNIEQVIVTTLSEVMNTGNESLITTVSTLHSQCSNSEESTEIKSNENIENDSLVSSSSTLDESLPSFIGEIDESVSLPPAEPLILAQDEHIEEKEEEHVTNSIVKSELNLDTSVDSQSETGKEVDENLFGTEIITENQSNDNVETVKEDPTLDENQTLIENIPSAVIIPDNVHNLATSETQEANIITSSDSNIQYTVLPPGENSVYQEDGTLVVEYPLNTEVMGETQGTNLREFISAHEVVDSPETSAIDMAGNIVMETSPEEDLSGQAGHVDDAVNKPKQPKRRGRKAGDGIPPHIVGAPIDNPTQDINGKGLKPRLGVKIPYRKLASQIVSTSELQNHIIERARMKEEARSDAEKKNLFAKKLTHRLAQSLLPKRGSTANVAPVTDSKKPSEGNVQIIENILAVIPATNSSVEEQPTNPIEIVEQIVNEETSTSEDLSNKDGEIVMSTSESIENAEIIFEENVQNPTNISSNSDLIAILEGDGDEGSLINVPNVVEIVDTSENDSEIKEIEKEITLTEQKTPQVKEKKFFKSRDSRVTEVSKENVKEGGSKGKLMTGSVGRPKGSSQKNEDPLKSNIFDIDGASAVKNAVKSGETKKNVDQEKSSNVRRKASGAVVEVEPQLKPAMVLKTYTRKRKSNDVATPEPVKKAFIVPTSPNSPDPKIDCVTPVPPNVYVTKSSRVIKKKVIWDPDEAMPSVRSQSKILNKIETSAKATSPSKLAVNQKATPVKSTDKKILENDKQTNQSIKITNKKISKPIQEDQDRKIIAEKPTAKKPEKVEIVKKPIAKTSEKTTPQAKILITSSMKIAAAVKSPKKSTKRLTEIDKLLMDEGAANMLNDINSSDDQKRRVSGRLGSSTPADKGQNQKELQNKTPEQRTEENQASNVVLSTPKTLRKKESTKKDKEMKEPSAIMRKMSKDSSKSSTHSPPPSPAAFTPGETSRIIRRHSSSSFSSTEGVAHDESMEETSEKDTEKQIKKKQIATEASAEPVEDSSSQEEQDKVKDRKKRSAFLAERLPKKRFKKDESALANGEPAKPTEIVVKSEPGILTGPFKTDPTKAFTVIKMNKHYMINLTYFGGDNYLTVQLLRDLVVTLKELERTRNCSVVSINSQGSHFCLGVDYKGLVESDETLRNKKILDMSNAIRDLLMCLLNFSKIIVAGVKGDCVGLGVTMLPLFDMIVATDTANFCTPYAKVGCPPEAGFLLAIPYQSNHGLASELLYTAHRMNADEAQRRGLVTKLFWPEKFDSEFRSLLSHISNLSKPALMVTKRQLRQANTEMAEIEIVKNSRLLKKYWGSEECQRDFVNYDAITFDVEQQ